MNKFPSFLAAGVVAFALITPVLAQTNLALSKPATASTVQAGNDIAKGNDGSSSSRWAASSSSYPQWWRVDLGSSQSVSKVEVDWYSAATRSYKYRIETSPDDATYTTRVDKTGNTTVGNTSDTFTAVNARYVRVTITGASGGSASFYEMRVFGGGGSAPVITGTTPLSGTVGMPLSYQIVATNSPTSYGASPLPAGLSVNTSTGLISGTPTLAGGPTNVTLSATNGSGTGTATLAITINPSVVNTNVALGQAATASTFQSGNAPANAADGNTASTRWAAVDATYPQWWRVDLGSAKTLTRADIAWYSSATRSYKYKIEISTDGNSYSTVVDKTANTAFGDTSDAFSATARYVRVTLTGGSSGTGFGSAYEFAIFGNNVTSSIRIVNATDHVQSRKRGVGMNSLSSSDFQALAPGVSWYYNWGSSPGSNVPPAGTAMTFYPMQWGNGSTTALNNYLASVNPKPPVILGINEPNLRGQAFINPQTTANLFASIKTVGNSYGIPVVGPQMALGSAPADSIVANDPFLGANYTYTSAEPFMNAFFYYANAAGTTVPAVSFHTYGGLGELKYFVQHFYDLYQRPVWVTEFDLWAAASQTEQRDFLVQATDYLEHTPFVAGYAWFKERDSGNANISLLGASGALTIIGQAYVGLPPHDGDLYYHVPGRLPAENYVNMANCDMRATTDTDGSFDLTTASNPSVDYNVQFDASGTYTVKFRATGAGTITLSKGGTTLCSVTTTSSGWQTVTTTASLTAGAQTLRVTATGSVTAINWIEFQ
ncbi:MAG: glycosyl hydrolase [Chthoniobacterales bacterium]